MYAIAGAAPDPLDAFKQNKKRKRRADDIDAEPEEPDEDDIALRHTRDRRQNLLRESASLGKGYRALQCYEAKEALRSLKEIPEEQYTRAWTYCQVNTGALSI